MDILAQASLKICNFTEHVSLEYRIENNKKCISAYQVEILGLKGKHFMSVTEKSF